ncbi:MAG: degP [Limisphaerales bacterium]|nr:MAG: degP [Limisphaerales bacterium]KAG0510381.1 MAG: degP [Limisphaerales bacterium]TXT51568.1 MAG: degP [Limisphaerales bacterium]
MKTNRFSTALCLLALAGSQTLAPLQAAQKESAAIALARQLNQAFIEVADQVSPSVVVIRVAQKQDRSGFSSDGEGNPFFEMLPREFRRQLEEQFEKRKKQPQSEPQPERPPQFNGQGSGVVIREDGYILTNRHVVEDAEKIEIRFKDGRTFPATIRGVDPRSDVAVLKIEAKGLPAAKFADSDKTRVGEFAIAIGAPFNLDYSVTFGHVSAKGRSALLPDASPLTPMDQDFIQTDASINPGNSGGPLVNINGEIIGINTLIRGLRSGIGFAIPANLARELSDALIKNGKVIRARLGLAVKGLKDDPELRAQSFKGVTDGILVSGIQQNGPAERSELKLEDVITHVEGTPVTNVQQLRNSIRNKVGIPVTLSVVRNGKPMKIKVTPEEWPDEPADLLASNKPSNEVQADDLGITVKALTRELAREHSVKLTEGLIVTEVDAGSPAAKRGLKAGIVITEVNGKPVSDLRDFSAALKGADLKKGVRLEIISDGFKKFEVLKSGD